MKDITFELVTDEDMKEVTEISIKSFHSDIEVGAEILKGPPGYDSLDFHQKMLKESSYFYKVLKSHEIIGAFWFMKKEYDEAYLYRLFIEPKHHKNGVGQSILEFIFQTFPKVKAWELQTPKWNRRTKQFYEKVGFAISEETENFYFFRKEFK